MMPQEVIPNWEAVCEMIFGRNSGVHPYDSAIKVWLASTHPHWRGMARNLISDHRVSERRESEFDSFAGEPRDANRLEEAINNYHTERIRTNPSPDYIDPFLNGDNFVGGGPTGKHELAKAGHLARVLDISGLGPVFQWAKNNGIEGFEDYGRTPEEAGVWLGEVLSGIRRRAFLGSLLEAMDRYRRSKPFQPTWSTTWADFEPHVSDVPERWLALLGVYKPQGGRWIMVLKYTVGEAGTLVRPTQLDAGWYAHHFPSPPQAPLSQGGHPMDLEPLLGGRTLSREFIHLEIGHKIEHWDNAGGLCARTAGPSSESFEEQRKLHHGLLVAVYGSEVQGWLPSPL